MQTLANTGEIALIEWIRQRVTEKMPGLPNGQRLGIGDDCAITVPSDPDQWDELLTSDAVIEQVHFSSEAEPAAVGHKAIGRCLSDIAAMGGEPRWALVNLVAPPSTLLARVEAVMNGLINTAIVHAVSIMGGDVATGPVLEVHVFMTGRVPAGRALTRHGASPGDALFVTGCLGGSIAGRHLTFQPRLPEGAWLRAGGWATAMIDLSDGLGLDLRRLLAASGVAGRIDMDSIPVADAATGMTDGRTALEHALYDGEDYELLFSVNSDKTETMIKAWPLAGLCAECTRIGEIVAGPAGQLEGVLSNGRRIGLEYGYEHFGTSDTHNAITGGHARSGGRMARSLAQDRNPSAGPERRSGQR